MADRPWLGEITPTGRMIGAVLLAAGAIFGVVNGVPWLPRTEAQIKFAQHEAELARLEDRMLRLEAAVRRLELDHAAGSVGGMEWEPGPVPRERRR